MKLKTYIPFLLTVILFSCNSTKEKKEPTPAPETWKEIGLYKDIDPFTLTGVDETKDIASYPYIKIEEGNNKKKITYTINQRDDAVRVYEKTASGWNMFAETFLINDTHNIYDYILADKVIELDYVKPSLDTGFYLLKVSAIQGDSSITYFMPDEKRLKPTPSADVFDAVKNETPVEVIDKMEVTGNTLKNTVSYFNKTENEITHTTVNCFSGGKRSWFWFRHFIPQAVPCK